MSRAALMVSSAATALRLGLDMAHQLVGSTDHVDRKLV